MSASTCMYNKNGNITGLKYVCIHHLLKIKNKNSKKLSKYCKCIYVMLANLCENVCSVCMLDSLWIFLLFKWEGIVSITIQLLFFQNHTSRLYVLVLLFHVMHIVSRVIKPCTVSRFKKIQESSEIALLQNYDGSGKLILFENSYLNKLEWAISDKGSLALMP